MIKTIKGLPGEMPERGKGRGRRPKYPWSTLQIGCFFLVPLDKKINGFYGHARAKYGYELTIEHTLKGWRVWRVR